MRRADVRQAVADRWRIKGQRLGVRGKRSALCGLQSSVAHGAATAYCSAALAHGLVCHGSRGDACCAAAPMRSLTYAQSFSRMVPGS